MALINYSEYFDFDGLKAAIKEAESANKEFATSTQTVFKNAKKSIDDVVASLKENKEILQNLNVNSKNAADGITQLAQQNDNLIKKHQQQIQVVNDVLAANSLLEKSVNDLKITQKALETEYNSLGNTEKKDIEYKKQIQQQVVKLKEAIASQNVVVKTAKTVIDAANGSYDKMQQELKAVGAQLRSLPNAFDPLTGKINQQNKEAVALNAKYLQLTTSLKTADAGMGNFFRNVGNYEGAIGKLTEGIGHFGMGLLAAVGIIPGLFGLVQFLEQSVELANEAEVNFGRLQNTLKNLGKEDAFDRLKEKAEGLSREFKTFRADEIVSTFQRLIVYGKLTEGQIDDLTEVIINFAAQQRISIEEATGPILKALEGNSRALKEYGINIKDAKNTTEAFGLIMTQLAPKVEGAAKAFGETTAGQIKKTEVEIQELKETIGQQLQPAIKLFYQTISDGLKGIPQIFESFKNFFSSLGQEVKFNAGIINSYFRGGFAEAEAYYNIANGKAKEAAEKNIDLQKKQEAEQFALSFAQAQATKTLKEQYEVFKQQVPLYAASKQKVIDLANANKLNTEEGRKAVIQLHQDKAILVELTKVYNDATAAKNKLGEGDPNALFNPKATKEDHSAEDAAKKAEEERKRQLAALQQYEQTRIQINIDALQRIASDESNSARVRIFALNKLADAEKDLATQRGEDEIKANQLTGNEVLAVREKVKQETIKIEYDTNAAIGAIIKKESADKVKAQNDVLNAHSAAIKAEVKAISDAADKNYQVVLTEAEKEKKVFEDVFNTLYNSVGDISQIIGSDAADLFAEMTRLLHDFVDDAKPEWQDFAGVAIAAADTITYAFQQAGETRIANLEKEKDHELTIAGNNAAAQAAINDRYAKEEAKIKRKIAIENKVAALFEIAVNTAVAATKVTAQTGLFGLPLIPLIIGLGAAEAALVLAQPIPQFEKGTQHAKEGWAQVDERGTELIVDRHGRLKEIGGRGPRLTYLNEGDKVFTAPRTKEILKQIEEGKIIHEMQLSASLSGKIRQGRQQEAIYTMSEALRATGMNNGSMVAAFEKAVQGIPLYQTVHDVNGVHERLIKRDGITTYRNKMNFGYKKP